MPYDPIQRAIDIQLGGIFSERPHNPENLIIKAIDLKHFKYNSLDESIVYHYLQGYTQEEIASLLGYSRQWIAKRLKRISLHFPDFKHYLVGRDDTQINQDNRFSLDQTLHLNIKRHKKDRENLIYPDLDVWEDLGNNVYRKKTLPTSDEQFDKN